MVSRGLAAAAAAALAIVALAGFLAFQQGGSMDSGDYVTVVVETEGLKAIYDDIACPFKSHRYVVLAPGGDPHLAQLTPSQARLVREADVVVVVPGSPAGRSAAELAAESGAALVVVAGLDLEWAYLDGNKVYHAPWYDPANAVKLLKALAEAEASVLPWCRGEVDSRLGNALRSLESLAASGGALEGSTVVADLPFNVYVARWLGASDVIVLRIAHEAEPPPSVKLQASKALKSGGVALVTVDLNGNPVSPTGEWLLEEASKAGSKVIRVPAPWLPIDLSESLSTILSQLS